MIATSGTAGSSPGRHSTAPAASTALLSGTARGGLYLGTSTPADHSGPGELTADGSQGCRWRSINDTWWSRTVSPACGDAVHLPSMSNSQHRVAGSRAESKTSFSCEASLGSLT